MLCFVLSHKTMVGTEICIELDLFDIKFYRGLKYQVPCFQINSVRNRGQHYQICEFEHIFVSKNFG